MLHYVSDSDKITNEGFLSTEDSGLKFSTVFGTTESPTDEDESIDESKEEYIEETKIEESPKVEIVDEGPSPVYIPREPESSTVQVPSTEAVSTSINKEEVDAKNIYYTSTESPEVTSDDTSIKYAEAVDDNEADDNEGDENDTDDNEADDNNADDDSSFHSSSTLGHKESTTPKNEEDNTEFDVVESEDDSSEVHNSLDIHPTPTKEPTPQDFDIITKGSTVTPEDLYESTKSDSAEKPKENEGSHFIQVKGRRPALPTIFEGSTNKPEAIDVESANFNGRPEGVIGGQKTSIYTGIKGKRPQKPFTPIGTIPGEQVQTVHHGSHKSSVKGGPVHKPIPGEGIVINK